MFVGYDSRPFEEVEWWLKLKAGNQKVAAWIPSRSHLPLGD